MVMSDLDRQATGAPEVPERTEPDECDHPTLYMQSWRGVEAFDGCLFCQRDEARSKLGKIQSLVNEQAEDEGLWFKAVTAPEAYLQQELRKLHAAIEAPK
jgi:hypothetical protein